MYANFDFYRLTAKQRKHKQAEQQLSKKMLGLDKYEEEKQSQNSWKNLGITSGLLLGTAIIGAAAWKFRYM